MKISEELGFLIQQVRDEYLLAPPGSAIVAPLAHAVLALKDAQDIVLGYERKGLLTMDVPKGV
jgi:hypothetical protein